MVVAHALVIGGPDHGRMRPFPTRGGRPIPPLGYGVERCGYRPMEGEPRLFWAVVAPDSAGDQDALRDAYLRSSGALPPQRPGWLARVDGDWETVLLALRPSDVRLLEQSWALTVPAEPVDDRRWPLGIF